MLLAFAGSAFGQKSVTLKGKVYDEQQQAVEFANVRLVETNQSTISTAEGSFSMKTTTSGTRGMTLEISYIGYQKQIRKITITEGTLDIGIVQIQTLDLSLKQIDINARRNYEGSSNSSLLISREMIEQIPALSISDLLNQIPNRKISAPSLQNVQNLSLRATFPGVNTGKSNPYELNNSFGVAIILDGQAISNNANMQTYNPGIAGIGSSNVTSEAYGLQGARRYSYTGDFAFGGTDLRQIPADNIESIEVISGVAPAKYGDLSEGAVIIERQAGKSPAYVRMQLRDNATSYSFSNGLKLSDKLGSLSLNLNYVNSFADNRDKLKAYKRLNSGAMWTNSYGAEKRLKNTLSIDYGRNLDGVKRDPDDPSQTETRFDSWNFSAMNRTSYRLNGSFLKNIGLNLKYAEGHQRTYTEEDVNKSYIMYSDATTTGITEGEYQGGIYRSVSEIDGRPVNLSARLDFNGELITGTIAHDISFGANYNYSINKGLGQVFDPSRPRVLTTTTSYGSSRGSSSERYYDFKLAIPQQDAGLYVEDRFALKIGNRNLNVSAGMRLDRQNGLNSFSPRTNLNYELNDNIKVGLAYGIGYKSPGLAHRYPGPTFIEIPLLNSYTGDARESIYLLYVERFEPSSKHLKPSSSQTLEFSTQLKLKKFNLSVTAFSKNSRNGISTVDNSQPITLPVYTATYRPGQQPLVEETGNKRYLMSYFSIQNDLSSNSKGLEMILNTPEIREIATSFNVSAGLFITDYHTKSNRKGGTPGVTSTDPDFANFGYYSPTNYTAYLSNGRITATTHIPKISLIAQFTADLSLMQKNKTAANYGVPVAYYTNDYRYITIENFDRNDPNYGHLYIPESELNQNNLPKVIANYHLSIGKEIKKRFKFSFNVYNVFNHQPSYRTTSGSITYPNSSPSFGAELSLKL